MGFLTRTLALGLGLPALGYAGYVATTWARYGRQARRPSELLDPFLPHYEVGEWHEARVEAPVESTFEAARAMTLAQSPLIRAIFRGRELIMGAESGPEDRRPLLEQTLAIGWGVLAETPHRSVVVGAVCRPWNADPGFRALPPEEFAAFAEPGYAKIAWTLQAEPDGPNASVFRMETRVVTTSPDARARFRRYWAALSPGIILIRWEGLRLVKEDAERRARHPTGSERTNSPPAI